MELNKQRQYLKLMDIDVWLERGEGTQELEASTIAEASKLDISQLDKLKQIVSVCQQCELHQSRTQTVFGTGDSNADWMIIGEAPGAEEDKQGEPFVGKAGRLLTSMLGAFGLPRERVFIANILKCRPPNNRDPENTEIEACESYLRQQIELVQPAIILAVGRVAAQNLLKVDTSIGQMRGQSYFYPGTSIPVVVTYHPAYLLRSPKEKRKSWLDLQLAKKIYQER